MKPTRIILNSIFCLLLSVVIMSPAHALVTSDNVRLSVMENMPIGISSNYQAISLRNVPDAYRQDGSVVSRDKIGDIYLDNVRKVTDCGLHRLILRTDGTVWAWGRDVDDILGVSDNLFYAVDDGILNSVTAPAKVNNLDGVVDIACGPDRSYAIKEDGTVWIWGKDSNGGTIYHTPIQMREIDNAVGISVNGYSVNLLNSNGTVVSFTSFGPESTYHPNTPEYVLRSEPENSDVLLDGIVTISSGGYHNLFLNYDGEVWFSGKPLSNSNFNPIAIKVNIPEKVVAVSAGTYYSLFLSATGKVYEWGVRWIGAVQEVILEPRPIQSLDEVSTIETGYKLHYAIKRDGSLWQWGMDHFNAGGTIYQDPVELATGTTMLQHDPLYLTVNNQIINAVQSPVIIDKLAYLPIRTVAEYLGAEVLWDEARDQISISTKANKISTQINSSIAVINGKEMIMEGPALLLNGYSMVPVRFILNAFGATVDWDNDFRSLRIITDKDYLKYSWNTIQGTTLIDQVIRHVTFSGSEVTFTVPNLEPYQIQVSGGTFWGTGGYLNKTFSGGTVYHFNLEDLRNENFQGDLGLQFIFSKESREIEQYTVLAPNASTEDGRSPRILDRWNKETPLSFVLKLLNPMPGNN